MCVCIHICGFSSTEFQDYPGSSSDPQKQSKQVIKCSCYEEVSSLSVDLEIPKEDAWDILPFCTPPFCSFFPLLLIGFVPFAKAYAASTQNNQKVQ